MALNIGNKKYRNMQEQVGWNSERIDKILEFLDGVNLSDNVVIVNDMSQILTPEELEIVNRTVSFLVYDGSLYIKKSQDATEAKFDIIFTISGSSVISFNSKEITVTLSNGALGIVVAAYSVYSVSQIDSLLSAKASISYVDAQLALKASLSGANFTGAITAPSIIENMSGYVYAQGTTANVVYNSAYVGACKNGNKLTLVWFGSLTPSVTITHNSTITLGTMVIPAAVGAKLYPYSQGDFGNMLDSKTISAYRGGVTKANCEGFTLKWDNTSLTLNVRPSLGETLEAGVSYILRYEVTFLLGDNLAQ